MHRRLVFLGLALLLVWTWIPGCGDEQPPQQPSGPAKTSTGPAPATQPGPAPTPPTPAAQPEPAKTPPKKVWPYLSKDYKEPMADDLLTRNMVLVYDGSGSMSEVQCSGKVPKIDVARTAVVEWTASVPPSANLGLVSFHAASGGGLTTLDLGKGNRETFIKTVQAIRPGGKTPLTESLKKAFEMLERQAQKQLGYGEYTVVVVTDGIANDPASLTNGVHYLLKYTPINIHTIGFCIGADHSLNQKGKTYYRTADNPEQLRQGLKDSLAESEDFDQADFK